MANKSSQCTLWKRELARYSGSCTSRLASSSWSNTAGPTNRKSPSLHRDRGSGGKQLGRESTVNCSKDGKWEGQRDGGLPQRWLPSLQVAILHTASCAAAAMQPTRTCSGRRTAQDSPTHRYSTPSLTKPLPPVSSLTPFSGLPSPCSVGQQHVRQARAGVHTASRA